LATAQNRRIDRMNTSNESAKIFEALSSTPRRLILSYLAETTLTSGQIAERFEMTRPALTKHLKLLENAGLVRSEKRGQYVHYSLSEQNLVNTLVNFAANFCPQGSPLKKESKRISKQKSASETDL